MPNQNDPTQNSNPVNPVSPPPVPPSIFPQSDLPPIPSVFSAVVETTPANTPVTPPIDTHAGSSAPPSFSSVTSKPKKKFGGGKIIATILGLVILVGGVGAGIMLTQQKQLINQKAQTPPYQCSNEGSVESCYGKSTEQTCTGGVGTCKQNTSGLGCYCDTGSGGGGGGVSGGGGIECTGVCADVTSCRINGCKTDGEVVEMIRYHCDSGGHLGCAGPEVERKYTDSMAFQKDCGSEQIDVYRGLDHAGYAHINYPNDCTATAPPITNPTASPTASPSPSPSPTPTATPTPTPTETPIVPSCIAVKAYDSEWIFIPEAQLPSLTVGNVVNFCVGGSAPAGTFDKAQFMINTVLKAEVITHARTGSDDFCQPYTILSTDTTIDVRAKIHHSTGGWVGENI